MKEILPQPEEINPDIYRNIVGQAYQVEGNFLGIPQDVCLLFTRSEASVNRGYDFWQTIHARIPDLTPSFYLRFPRIALKDGLIWQLSEDEEVLPKDVYHLIITESFGNQVNEVMYHDTEFDNPEMGAVSGVIYGNESVLAEASRKLQNSTVNPKIPFIRHETVEAQKDRIFDVLRSLGVMAPPSAFALVVTERNTPSPTYDWKLILRDFTWIRERSVSEQRYGLDSQKTPVCGEDRLYSMLDYLYQYSRLKN